METAGALRIFERSVATRALKNKNILGDGDPSTYSAIVESKPYGEDYVPNKLECVGRVQKRVGSGLRKLKSLNKGVKLSNDPLSKIVDSVFKKLFATKEILNSYITGKRSIKSSDEGPRPALDQERFTVFLDIVLASCEASRKEIIEKVQNVMKTTSKKQKTSQK